MGVLRTDVLVPFGSSRITHFILHLYVTELPIGWLHPIPVLSSSRQKLGSQLYMWPLSERDMTGGPRDIGMSYTIGKLRKRPSDWTIDCINHK